MDYFKSTNPEGEVSKIVLCGGTAKVTGLMKQLDDRMGVVVELANPFNQIDTTSGKFDPDYLASVSLQAAVGVGLAIRAIGDR